MKFWQYFPKEHIPFVTFRDLYLFSAFISIHIIRSRLNLFTQKCKVSTIILLNFARNSNAQWVFFRSVICALILGILKDSTNANETSFPLFYAYGNRTHEDFLLHHHQLSNRVWAHNSQFAGIRKFHDWFGFSIVWHTAQKILLFRAYLSAYLHHSFISNR